MPGEFQRRPVDRTCAVERDLQDGWRDGRYYIGMLCDVPAPGRFGGWGCCLPFQHPGHVHLALSAGFDMILCRWTDQGRVQE